MILASRVGPRTGLVASRRGLCDMITDIDRVFRKIGE